MLKKVLIASPCYNEEENIIPFVKKVENAISNVKSKINEYDFEILFIDDGSKDETLNNIRRIRITSRTKIHYLSFSRNFGKEAGMKSIFDYAYKNLYDSLILMDVDLQDDPMVIPELISKWESGYEHVFTKHKNRKGQGLIKKVCSKVFYTIYSQLTGFKDLENGARDFALFDKKVIKAYAEFPNQDRFTKGISEYVGFKKYCVTFDYSNRKLGKTKWNYRKLFKYAVTGFNSFSEWLKIIPRLIIILSLIFTITDITYIVNNFVDFETTILNNSNLRFDITWLFMSILISVVIDLLYQNKKFAENKQLYIISETDEVFND